MNRIGRRALLGGMGASALLLPFARNFRIHAQNEIAPKRLLIWFTPNGTIHDEWAWAAGSSFELGQILEPLSIYKEDLLLLDGVNIDPQGGPGDAHQKGMGCLLTGRELLPGDVGGGCDSCAPVSWASGISIDQRIAQELVGLGRSSIEFGLACGSNADIWTRMCYSGSGQPLPPEQNPFDLFDRLFGGAEQDPEQTARRKALRKSVLDYLQSDLAKAQSRLGQQDRKKLEVHAESLRELEKRLESGLGSGQACAPVSPGDPIDLGNAENYPVLGKHQLDLIAMSFACDITRVASMQWNRSVGNQTFAFAGVSGQHHTLSHEAVSNPDARDDLVKINRWYAEQLAYLVAKLKAMPEGDGSVMDNTLIVWVNELSEGESHSRINLPVLMVGSAGGYFQSGRYLTFNNQPQNNLWVSVANAMGVDIDTFGDPAHCDGPLTGLTG
ncbi:MAG: DUF1552 domain-containing protein [Myxococcales bacterium]|nr:MAG: DUF1552 domain-containing protein [Myxococcales bacterium]